MFDIGNVKFFDKCFICEKALVFKSNEGNIFDVTEPRDIESFHSKCIFCGAKTQYKKINASVYEKSLFLNNQFLEKNIC